MDEGGEGCYELEQISNESSRGTRKPGEYSRFFSVVSFFRFESTLFSLALCARLTAYGGCKRVAIPRICTLLLLNVPCTMKDVHFNEAKEFAFVNGRIFLSFKVGSTPFGILFSTTRSFVISFVSYTLTHTRPTRPYYVHTNNFSQLFHREFPRYQTHNFDKVDHRCQPASKVTVRSRNVSNFRL